MWFWPWHMCGSGQASVQIPYCLQAKHFRLRVWNFTKQILKTPKKVNIHFPLSHKVTCFYVITQELYKPKPLFSTQQMSTCLISSCRQGVSRLTVKGEKFPLLTATHKKFPKSHFIHVYNEVGLFAKGECFLRFYHFP